MKKLIASTAVFAALLAGAVTVGSADVTTTEEARGSNWQ